MPVMMKRWHLVVMGGAVAASYFAIAAANGKPVAPNLPLVLARSVATDSQSWFLNHYDAESLGHFQVVRRETPHSLIVRGTYTYNGGQPGWVMARIVDGRVQCLQYWDKNFCKNVGLGTSHPAFSGRGYSQESQPETSNSHDLSDCMENNPFTVVGHACREFGVGVEADRDRAEAEEAQRQADDDRRNAWIEENNTQREAEQQENQNEPGLPSMENGN